MDFFANFCSLLRSIFDAPRLGNFRGAIFDGLLRQFPHSSSINSRRALVSTKSSRRCNLSSHRGSSGSACDGHSDIWSRHSKSSSVIDNKGRGHVATVVGTGLTSRGHGSIQIGTSLAGQGHGSTQIGTSLAGQGLASTEVGASRAGQGARIDRGRASLAGQGLA